MRTLFLMSALGLSLAPANLDTEYKAGVGRKITIESSLHMENETTIERDGESSPGMGGSSDTENTEVHVDQIVEAEGGKPTKVRRHFVELGGKMSTEMGENSSEADVESPWNGVTVELTADEAGKVLAEVVEGTEPDGEGALDGHAIGLFLDGFLPSKAVEEGDEWEIESAAIVRGLRLDVERKLFPPPPRPERGGGGGGGGGRRGGRGGSGGESPLAQSEWTGTGKLGATEEKNGVACVVIALVLETSGEREIEAMGGRGPRALNASFDNRRLWSAKLEGKLWFDMAAKQPVALEVEGTYKSEMHREFEREGSTTKMDSTGEGKLEIRVEVETQPAEPAKPAK